MRVTHFTSVRERRLWLGALAVVGAIYCTLAFAGTLADVLRTRGLLDAAFALCFLLVVAAIAWSALRKPHGALELWAVLGITAVYGMIVVRLGIGPAERSHLFEYGLLAVLVHEALRERLRNGRHVPIPALLAVVVTALLGWLDEGIQALLPNRVYDIRDVGVNALAALMAVVATLVLAGVRHRVSRRRTNTT